MFIKENIKKNVDLSAFSDCRQSPHVKVWTFLVFSTIQMHLYDIHTNESIEISMFSWYNIYEKRCAMITKNTSNKRANTDGFLRTACSPRPYS